MTVERRARRKPPPPPGLAPWLRNAVMIATMVGWLAVVAGYLAQHQLPDAPLLGIPGAVYLAMSPPTIRRRAKRSNDDEDDA